MRSICLVILFCFMFSATGAYAAPVTLPQTVTPGFFSTTWDVERLTTTTGGPYTGSCPSSGTGFGINDATGPTGASDAYDQAYLVFVDGVLFDPGSTVDLTGTTITAGPVAMSGLNVTVQYYFDTQAALARIMVSLSNPTALPINATVDIPVNFGSDSGTIVQMTSSGDTTFTTADRWLVTSDSGPGDAVNTTVLFGPGGLAPSAVTQTVFDCAATNGMGATYDISVPAGQTRSLLLFAGLGDITGNGNTVAGAIAGAQLFDSGSTLPAGALTGLSSAQISSVVNWQDIGQPEQVRNVPTMTEWGMIIFVALAGLGSVYYLRRQRRV